MAKKGPLLKSLTRGDFKTAMVVIQQNRARSMMTMLGIIIAVISVVLIIGIGEGIKQQVESQVAQLGKNLILVRPGRTSATLAGGLSNLAGRQIGGLDNRDLHAVAAAKGITDTVPLSIIDGVVTTDENNKKFDGVVIATNDGFPAALHQKVAYGAFLGSDGNANRAAIGSDVAARIFGENVPLGRSFTFRGQEFIVSGILNQFDSNPLLGDANFNNAIFINYDLAKHLTGGDPAIYQIFAQSKDNSTVDTSVASIQQKLRAVHGGADDFSVLKQGQSLTATNNILSLLTKFIIGAAAVALLIGGVGIMNIMLVSVTERMHEIGIRKAVGATNRQILAQFVTESMVLSSVGALLGFALAAAIIGLMRLFTDIHPIMPWLSAVLTLIAAVLAGAVFGAIPAMKAARKDPIEALRNE